MNNSRLLLAGVSFLAIVLLSTIASPVSSEPNYSPRVTPNSYGTPQLRWIITNVTEETVFFWTGNVAWHANAGDFVFFQIQEIKNNDTYGQFTLGNMSVFTNDTNIGADLVLGIWPWQPGLVSLLNWETVDLEARAAVTGFLDGTFKILTDSTSKTYIYNQNKTLGNQNTTLSYDLETGILKEAYTEFFFFKDYHLGLELVQARFIPSPLGVSIYSTLGALVFIIIVITVSLPLLLLRPKT